MDDLIQNYSRICSDAVELSKSIKIPTFSFDKIAICGVGGSGVVGDLIKDILRDTAKIQIEIVKDYHLPKYIDNKTLVFCISYSGNTEETLNQLVEARERGCNIVSVASGGKLKEWSGKLGLESVQVPGGMQPRDSLPFLLTSLLICFQNQGIGNYANDISEMQNAVNNVDKNFLDRLAMKIKTSDIAIYGSNEFSGVVRRFKNDFNENAKMLVKYDLFPELNHNEINGYQRGDLLRNSNVIFLRDREENEETRVRFEITKGLLSDYVNDIYELWAVGNSKLAKVISFVFMSSYLIAKIAELVGINRERVILVEKLKDELKQKLNLVEKLEERLFKPRQPF